MLTASRRSLAGAFIAAVLGVTAVCTSALLYASARPQVPDIYRDAAVVVQSPAASGEFVDTVPWPKTTAAFLTASLARIDGVAAAVAVRQFYAQPMKNGRAVEGATVGYGWAATMLGGYRLAEGSAPRNDRDLAVGPGIGAHPGDHLTVLTASGPGDYLVTGVVAHGGDNLWLSDQTAETFAPGVRAIGLRLAPGADVLAVAGSARAISRTGGKVLTHSERTALESRADARTRWIGLQILTAVASLSGFVTVFVVAGTYAFSVAQRRREFALVRILGATPRQVRGSLRREALTVGALASVTGTILGALLAPLMAAPLVAAGAEPASYTVRPQWWPIAASLVIGPLLSVAGAMTASWRASRVSPLDALRDAAVEERPMGRLRWAAGLLLAALGLGLVVLMATSGNLVSLGNLASFAAMALITAAALLAPALVPPLARLFGALFSRGAGAIGLLVREGAAAAPRRTASVAAPVLLTLAFSALVSGLFATTTASYAARRTDAVRAGSVLAPDGTPGLSDAVVTPVVNSGGAVLLPSTAYTADRQALLVLGAETQALAAADKRAHALTALTKADDIAVTQAAATRVGLAQGETLRLTFADGAAIPLHVATVLPDNIVPAEVLLSRTTLRSHDANALASAVLLPGDSAGAASAGAGNSALSPSGHAAIAAGPGARVVSVATWAGEQDAQDNRVAWTFVLLLIAVSAGYGALSLVNTLLMAAGGRAPDFRLLRRAGATPRQIGWAAAGEATLVVAIGALLAAAITVPALLGIRAGLSAQMGAHVPLVVPWATLGAILAGTLVLAVAAAAGPARRSARSAQVTA